MVHNSLFSFKLNKASLKLLARKSKGIQMGVLLYFTERVVQCGRTDTKAEEVL